MVTKRMDKEPNTKRSKKSDKEKENREKNGKFSQKSIRIRENDKEKKK